MKVLLLKDVYKLGRAGDVKKVADGYGRNYLVPKGFAVLATAGAMKQIDSIKAAAAIARDALNKEMTSTAEQLNGQVFNFVSKAGETGKLYGSITTQMLVDAIKEKTGVVVDRHQIEVAPIRNVGDHIAKVRLTVDLVPEITVVVTKEGQAAKEAPKKAEPVAEPAETPVVEEPAEAPEAPAEEAAE